MTTGTRKYPAVAVLIGVAAIALSVPGVIPAEENPVEKDEAVYVLQAHGLACPFCAYGIEKHLGRIEGVASVETDIESGTVTVTMEPGASLSEADAERALDNAGFTLRGFRRRES